MRPIYLQFFRVELLLEPTSFWALTFTKGLTTVGIERELHIGKLRVMWNKARKYSRRKVLLEVL